jgi:hypothetical protein
MVTVTASVTSSGAGLPTGQVTFQEGSTTLAQVPLNSSASASFSISTLSVGTHTITASYASDSLCAGSSGSTTLTVQSGSGGGSPPSAPGGLQTTPGPGRKQITLTWKANPAGDNVTSYDVWHSSTGVGGPFSKIKSVTGTSYTDSLGGSGFTEYYYVIANSATGSSQPSTTVQGISR